MKLRVRHNSIRLRLSQREITQFNETGRVEEAIEFGANKFIYAIEKTANSNEISAVFENCQLTVFVPRIHAEDWVSTEQIGIEAEQNIGGEKSLRILIEKDFACQHAPRRGEDDEDVFPNPSEDKVC